MNTDQLRELYSQSKLLRLSLVPYVVLESDEPEEAQALLASCYTGSLNLAKDFESVAFSGISTGIYGYPLQDATIVAINTVKEWLSTTDSKLRTVTLCAFTEKEYAGMVEAVKVLSVA